MVGVGLFCEAAGEDGVRAEVLRDEEATLKHEIELSRKAALEDISQLAKTIVESHPDPFLYVSSPISFFERVGAITSELRRNEVSARDFWVAASKITALVGDGHTSLDVPIFGPKRLWLEAEPLEGSLVVSGVYRSSDTRFLGARIRSIEGIPLETLIDRIRTLRGSDGPESDLMHLSQALRSEVMLGHLLQREEIGESLFLGLDAQGANNQGFPFVAEKRGELLTPRTTVEVPAPGPNDMSWVVLPGRGDVAYLRIDSMRKYRENFEYQRSSGASEEFVSELLTMAGFASQGDLPNRIQSVPSASQTILDLVSAMKARGITNLVVDLRKNSGGNSYLAYMLAYFLYGEKAFGVDEGYVVKRHSRLEEEQFPGAEVRQLEGGYDFSDKRRWDSGKRGVSQAEWDVEVARSPTFRNAALGYESPIEPRVFVLTSAATFSAGFDLAFLLKKLGGVVVGVGPSQPDNAFLETLRFSLPNSGLKGWVSSKLMMKNPAEPIHHRLKPDVELTYDQYRGFSFDPNSSLLLALRLLTA